MVYYLALYHKYQKNVWASGLGYNEFEVCKNTITNLTTSMFVDKYTRDKIKKYLNDVDNIHKVYTKQILKPLLEYTFEIIVECLLYEFPDLTTKEIKFKKFISLYCPATQIHIGSSNVYETEEEACANMVKKLLNDELNVNTPEIKAIRQKFNSVHHEINAWKKSLIEFYISKSFDRPAKITLHVILHEVFDVEMERQMQTEGVPIAEIVNESENESEKDPKCAQRKSCCVL